MKHYEIILVSRPNNDAQLQAIVDRYKAVIAEYNGVIHRYEDWGKRSLAYPIQKNSKGHYILMNVEVSSDAIIKIRTLASSNEALLRYLVINVDEAITTPSPILLAKDKKSTQGNRHNNRNYKNDSKKPESKEPAAEEKPATEAKETPESN